MELWWANRKPLNCQPRSKLVTKFCRRQAELLLPDEEGRAEMSCDFTCCTCSRRCVRFEKLQLPPNNNDNRIALFPTPLLQSMACACTSEMHPCQDLVLQIAIGWWGNLAWTGSLSPDRAIIFLVGRYGSTENSSPESYEFLGLGAPQ